MLTNKGFNIPVMHSCVNWTATNPLCTNPEKLIPLFTSSVSVEKQQQKKHRHTLLAGSNQIKRLFVISVSRRQCSSVLYKQENKRNCSNSAVQTKSRTHISPNLYKSRRRIKHAVQICQSGANQEHKYGSSVRHISRRRMTHTVHKSENCLKATAPQYFPLLLLLLRS